MKSHHDNNRIILAGFPGAHTGPYMITEIVGFLCAGLAAAPVLGRQPTF